MITARSFRLVESARLRCAFTAALAGASSLSGCSGSGSTPSCGSAQVLSVVAYSTGAAPYDGPGFVSSPQPYSSSATFLYFSATGGPEGPNPSEPSTVTGTPVLKGSDGSTLTGGPLVADVTAHDLSANLQGYSSSIAGLAPNVTYAVSFASLGSGTNSCRYGGEAAGSFVTD